MHHLSFDHTIQMFQDYDKIVSQNIVGEKKLTPFDIHIVFYPFQVK